MEALKKFLKDFFKCSSCAMRQLYLKRQVILRKKKSQNILKKTGHYFLFFDCFLYYDSNLQLLTS